jgi:hypothetical protein
MMIKFAKKHRYLRSTPQSIKGEGRCRRCFTHRGRPGKLEGTSVYKPTLFVKHTRICRAAVLDTSLRPGVKDEGRAQIFRFDFTALFERKDEDGEYLLKYLQDSRHCGAGYGASAFFNF